MLLYGRIYQWLQLKWLHCWGFFVLAGIMFFLLVSLGVNFAAHYLVHQQVRTGDSVVGEVFLSSTEVVKIPVNIDGWYGDGNNRFFRDSSLNKILHLSIDKQVNSNLVSYMLYGDSVDNATDYQESWGVLGRKLGWSSVVSSNTDYTNDLYTPLAQKTSFILPIRSVPAGRLDDMVFRVSLSRSDLWDVRLDGIYWSPDGFPVSMSFYWQKDYNVSPAVLLHAKHEMLRIVKLILSAHKVSINHSVVNVGPPKGFHFIKNSHEMYHRFGRDYVGYRWGGMPGNDVHLMYGGLFLPGGHFAIPSDTVE